MTTQLERAARSAWWAWGEYAKATHCDACGEERYCRRSTRRARWLCLDCFDLSPEGETFSRRRHTKEGPP